MRDARPTYRHDPPVPQAEGGVTQLETQETKHGEELRAEKEQKRTMTSRAHAVTYVNDVIVASKKWNCYFSELFSKSQSCWWLRNTYKDVKEG